MWRPSGTGEISRATLALAAGLTLLAVALVVTLSGSPIVVARANGIPPNEPILKATSGGGACQDGEVLQAGISAIRLTLVAVNGPSVSVTVSSPTGLLGTGRTGSGWTAGAVTVPVHPLDHAVAPVRVCFKLGRSVEEVEVAGSHASASQVARSLDGRPVPGRFTVEYMKSGASSWWSLAETIARRIGLGHAPSGTWVVLALAIAMGAALAGASWLAVRELR